MNNEIIPESDLKSALEINLEIAKFIAQLREQTPNFELCQSVAKTHLNIAREKNNLPFLKSILSSNLDLKLNENDYAQLIYFASANNDLPYTMQLVEKFAELDYEIEKIDKEKLNSLIQTSGEINYEIIQYLISQFKSKKVKKNFYICSHQQSIQEK